MLAIKGIEGKINFFFDLTKGGSHESCSGSGSEIKRFLIAYCPPLAYERPLERALTTASLSCA